MASNAGLCTLQNVRVCRCGAAALLTRARKDLLFCRNSSLPAPSLSHRRGAGQAGLCRAEGEKAEDGPLGKVDAKLSETIPGGSKLAPGQLTAILTGAISLVLGIAYLAFVFYVDSQGGQLKPPPPEAMGF